MSASDIPVLKANLQSVVETSDVSPLAREIYEQNKKSVVKVEITSPDGSTFRGSGVLVRDGKDGQDVSIVTNAHVGANARSITLTNAAGETFGARLDKFDDVDDLAVLKADGVKIDRSRAVDLGDASSLKSGQMLYLLGHPRGYDRPVLGQGRFDKLDTFANFSPETGEEIRKAVGLVYPNDKGYFQDGEDLRNSPRISASVPGDHGESGGPLLDDKGKLVGILETARDDSDKTLSVSVDRVKQLLDDPIYKFQFNYSRSTLAQNSPLATTAKAAGIAALAAPATRKFAAPLAGLYYGGQALDDIKMLGSDSIYRSRTHYWEKLALDGGTFVAGALSLVPRFRTAAAIAVGARLAIDAVTDFTSTTPVLDSYKRNDGRKGEPIFWTASHH